MLLQVCLPCLILFTVAWPTPSVAQTYDAAVDFTSTTNGSGVWSYGYTTALGSAFNVYDSSGMGGFGVDYWWASALTGISNLPPTVSHNGTGAVVINPADDITIQIDQLFFHPGPSDQKSIVRWTAPLAAIVHISAVFGHLDLQAVDTDVHVLHNNSTSPGLFDGMAVGFGDNLASFDAITCVDSGDTIDFVVGYGNGAYNHDTTSIAAVVTVVQPCLGDSNHDGTVNFADVTATLADWLADYSLSPCATGPGDANLDGHVSFADVTEVLARWLEECQ